MENLEFGNKKNTKEQALKNWETQGSLGVTAEDYELIGGTPDDILIQNPGKTLGILMSDDEIQEFIEGTQRNIEENKNYPHMNEFNEDLKKNLITTIKYLKKINRLSEDFILKTP